MTIFNYMDLATRHRNGSQHPIGAISSRIETKQVIVDSVVPAPHGGSTMCATWPCPGCGKQLISAVHQHNKPPTKMFCTRECREEHQ